MQASVDAAYSPPEKQLIFTEFKDRVGDIMSGSSVVLNVPM